MWIGQYLVCPAWIPMYIREAVQWQVISIRILRSYNKVHSVFYSIERYSNERTFERKMTPQQRNGSAPRPC